MLIRDLKLVIKSLSLKLLRLKSVAAAVVVVHIALRDWWSWVRFPKILLVIEIRDLPVHTIGLHMKI